MNSEVFVKSPPTKLFFRCAVPSMITMAFGALFSIADGVFVGRFLGEDALAAINLIMPVIMIVEALSNMIATGSSVKISVLLGENKREDASAVFSFSIKIIFIISTVLGIIGFAAAKPFICLIAPGAGEKAIGYSVEYFRVYAAFSPIFPIYYATDNYLRVCGKEKLSMILSIVSQALNIILNTILIVVLRQGVWAAALTSCFSMALGAVVSLLLFTKKRMDLYYTRKKISGVYFLRILANGSSEFFSGIATSVMSLIMNLFLLKFGGSTAVAAFSVIMYVDSIVGMLIFGMCDSLQPAISYCHGAGRGDRVKAIFKRIVVASIILSLLSMLFMLFVGRYIAPVFIEPGNTVLLKVSIEAMIFFSFSYPVGWIDMCFSSLFTALERPSRSLLTSLFGTVVFPVIFLFINSAIWGLNGIWLMPVVSGAASGILTIILAKTMEVKYNVRNQTNAAD